ncbi:MAG: hypothetical protein CME62_08240 [Halobacteriovoraceae bacterium]|nr:hypothetical protein [Halobacteriovoraceae bacterium]|tara:strand:- start:19670 stop:20662 length:993 start_codon:yes stop_codon:yes gene_type:complete
MIQRNEGVDLYRGLGCILVLVIHYISSFYFPSPYRQPVLDFLFPVGGAAVLVFFVLSSYLLFLRFETYKKFEKSKFKTFYLLRFVKIYPAWVITCLIKFAFTAPFSETVGWRELLLNLTFLFGFFPSDTVNYTVVGWSLHIEEVFYLFAPLLFLFKNRVFFLIIFLATILLKNETLDYLILQNYPHEHVPLTFRFFTIHIHHFIFGIYLAILNKNKKSAIDLIFYLGIYFYFDDLRSIYVSLVAVIFIFGLRNVQGFAHIKRVGIYCLPFYLFHGLFLALFWQVAVSLRIQIPAMSLLVPLYLLTYFSSKYYTEHFEIPNILKVKKWLKK